MRSRFVVLASALCCLLICRIAAADFSFVHITDTHITASDAEGSNAAKVTTLYREISGLTPRPAFVASTGDVCEIGTDAEYEQHQKTLTSLQVPCYAAPGNHDVRWNPRGKEGYTLGAKQPLYQSWDYENVHFILLDSTVLLQHWGHFDQAQLEWLERDLKKTGRRKPVVIGFHHFIVRPGGKQVDNEAALLKVLEPYNVRLFLIGHGHSDIAWNINGVPAIMAKGLYQGSYNVVKVTKDKLTVYRRTTEAPTPTAEVLSVPLAPMKPPTRAASVVVNEGQGIVRLISKELPAETTVAFQYDAGDAVTMEAKGGAKERAWEGRFLLAGVVPGEHQVQVTATLPDGRAYQTTVTINLSGPNTARPLWTRKVGGGVQGKLAAEANTVYVPTMGGELVALDTETGRVRWRYKTGGAVFSAPRVKDGMVVFGSADHFVYAVDSATGRLIWKAPTGGAVFAGAAITGKTVCIASTDTYIYGLDIEAGREVWKAKGENMFQSQIATDGERFYIGGWDNYFRCLDAKTGNEVWKQAFGKTKEGNLSFYYAPAIGGPAVGEGKALVTSNDGMLHALETAQGTLLWEVPGPSLGYSGPLLQNERVYNASLTDQGRVFCFDATNGKKLWEAITGSVIYDSSCVAGGGNVFVGGVDGTFTAMNQASGRIVWQYRLAPGHLLASPAAGDDRVFIGSLSGEVVAFSTRSQQEILPAR